MVPKIRFTQHVAAPGPRRPSTSAADVGGQADLEIRLVWSPAQTKLVMPLVFCVHFLQQSRLTSQLFPRIR